MFFFIFLLILDVFKLIYLTLIRYSFVVYIKLIMDCIIYFFIISFLSKIFLPLFDFLLFCEEVSKKQDNKNYKEIAVKKPGKGLFLMSKADLSALSFVLF